MTPTVLNIVVAIIIGLLLWVIKRFLETNLTSKIDIMYGTLIKLQQELDEHKEECSRMPKSLIVEKIDNLTDKIDASEKDNKEFKQEIREELKIQRARTHELNNHLMKLLGRPN